MTEAPNLTPIRLRCEHRKDPLGLDAASPRLSWALDSKARGKWQTAYQILVSDNEQGLQKDMGNLWDSGKVSSDETTNVVYEGGELRSGTRCYWKVRAWDEYDNPSEYSVPALWAMGLLRRSDWSASWISLGEDAPGGIETMGLRPSPYLRKTFELNKPVRAASLYATARGVYELRLNGARVGDAVLAPGWTDYDKRIQYQTYDVTQMLATGENVIGGILGDGWFAGFVGMDPKRRGAHYGPRPQLLVQLNVEYEDGTTRTIVSDGSWGSSTGPIVFSDLLMGETYDAREGMDGWDRPGFDDLVWHPVNVKYLDDTPLVAELSQPVKVVQEVEAKALTEPTRGVYVFDLGQNMVGWVRLKVEGDAGTTLTLRHAEALNPDGTIYTDNLRTAWQTDTYVLKGSGLEVFEPHFTFHGFRYVEVTGCPGEPPLDAITGRVIHSATPPSGSFECSSLLVNKLQNNIVWGQRGNFLSIPTDCPQRDERLGWMGDAQVFIRTASYNMDVSAFFTKWMVDIEDAQSPEGAFPDVAPLLGELSVIDLSEGAPAWADAGIIVPWTIYRVYGDTRIIVKHYDAMARWIEYMHQANPDLVRKNRLNNNFGDWLSPEGSETPKDLLATAYFAYDAKLMSEMTQAIGRQDDARKYEELFRDIKTAFNEAYVEPDGRIKGGTQTCYVLALHMDLLPEDKREIAARHLVEAIEEQDWHLSTGFVGVGYLLPVLTEAGYVDVAFRLLNNDTFPSWGYTIRHGATTIWERWDGWTEEKGFQSPLMNSFNHYSLGSVGEWLYRYVAGIDLDRETPGYGRIVIRPRPGGGLTHARGEYDSVRGTIVSAWSIEGDEFNLGITIPPNTTATVHVPVTGEAGISEGGKPVEYAEGAEVLSMGEGEVILAVGSGDYEFAGKLAR